MNYMTGQALGYLMAIIGTLAIIGIVLVFILGGTGSEGVANILGGTLRRTAEN